MIELGHNHIDVLKMDIEGSEFAVIDDVLNNNGIDIKQICVETHARFIENGNLLLIKMIEKLRIAGYKIFYVSDNGEEFSFIKD